MKKEKKRKKERKCCPRAKDRVFSRICRLRGQNQGLGFRGEGQGLQNVSSRNPSLLLSMAQNLAVLKYD